MKVCSVLSVVLAVVFMHTYFSHEEVPRTVHKEVPSVALSFPGACDISAGVDLTSSLFVVADDENNVLRIYNRDKPSLPVEKVDLSSFLQIEPDHPETDIEAATRVNQLVYWITSHGRNKDGKTRPNRYRFFATALRTSGDRIRLEPIGTPCITLAQ